MTADSEIKLLPRRAEGLEGPEVLGVFAAEDVALAGGQENTKIRCAGRVPTVFDFGDVHHLLAELQLGGALVALVAGVTFHANHSVNHFRALLCGCRQARHSTPRPGK